MPLIKDETQYNIDTNISDRDTVIGSDHDSGGKTKNFKLLDIAKYVESKIDTGVDFIGSQILNGNYINIEGTYDYFVWADDYVINSQRFTSYISSTISLPTSHSSLDRIDAVILNNNGTISVITGAPSETPSVPSVDYETQLLFFFVIVKANTTSPEGVSTKTIYNENLQIAGGEFDTDVIGSVDVENENEYQNGTKSIYFSGSGSVVLTNDVNVGESKLFNIIFRIKLENQDDHKLYLTIGNLTLEDSVFPGGSFLQYRSTDVVFIEDGVFGFDSTNTTSWQTIIIPFNAFINSLPFNQIWLTSRNNDSRLYVDNIIIQEGIALTSSNTISRTSQLINDGSDGVNPFLKQGDCKVKIEGYWFDTTENTDKNAIEIGNYFDGWNGDYNVSGKVIGLPFNISDSTKVKLSFNSKIV